MCAPYTGSSPDATRPNPSPGKSELIAALRGEIARAGGHISFERFMEQALYHPQWGYYAAAAEIPTGRHGDYFTNVSVGAIYGEFIARQLAEVWELLGRPGTFTIVEQGAMDAQNAVDMLTWIAHARREMANAVRYVIIEPFERNRDRQRRKVEAAGVLPFVRWAAEWDEIAEGSIVGAVFSNELVDAFPVKIARYSGGAWRERMVREDGANFAWAEKPVSDATLQAEIARLPLPPLEGYTTEINLRAGEWMRTVASRLQAGLVLTVDYGFLREAYYAPERSAGTLQCYRAHQRGIDPLVAVGEQDITAHVDFTTLEEAGRERGLRTLGFTDQHHFFTALAAAVEAEGRKYSLSEIRQLKTLLHPEMLGTRFQYFAQGKGLPERVKLSGFGFGNRF